MDPARGPRSSPGWEHLLNADPSAQGRLLDLQDVDSRLDQAAHRSRTMAEHAEVARLSAARAEIDDEVVRADTECGDLERERAKAEADVEQVRTRAARDRQRLDAGTVGSARDLENLQHELVSLARRQSDLEEVELEIMERLEIAQARLRAARAERDQLDADLAVVVERRDGQQSAIDAERADLQGRRTAIAAELPPDLLTLYEKLREQHGGIGAAALRQRRCEGCRLELNATELVRIRTAPAEEVLRCDECRRILVRRPDSGL